MFFFYFKEANKDFSGGRICSTVSDLQFSKDRNYGSIYSVLILLFFFVLKNTLKTYFTLLGTNSCHEFHYKGSPIEDIDKGQHNMENVTKMLKVYRVRYYNK